MNKYDLQILRTLSNNTDLTQRKISGLTGISLGLVNKVLKRLCLNGYITEELELLDKAERIIDSCRPKNAIILAAGSGLGMMPLNYETPKALLEVKNEILVERLIRQLHDVGIRNIIIVVGFKKERFDYLIDKYGVKLIVNNEYARSNNFISLLKAEKYIDNCYIVPSDLYCRSNMFCENETTSWYLLSDAKNSDSYVLNNKKCEIVVSGSEAGQRMIGISYLCGKECREFREFISHEMAASEYRDLFWEDVLFSKTDIRLAGRVVPDGEVTEIRSFNDLMFFDSDSASLKTQIIEEMLKAMNADLDNITDVSVLKKGMTNRSFLFTCRGQKYVMRIPGEGTDRLINRKEEYDSFKTIEGLGLCDDPIYLNPNNGIKITNYVENSRCCDPFDAEDLKQCMAKLRSFHGMKLKTGHRFDIFKTIDFYEKLWEGRKSVYPDYEITKKNILSLQSYIAEHAETECLAHIDSVPDNFLFGIDASGRETLQLIDWEYSGMQDPHVDIAMFCIYAIYDKDNVDRLIDIYFENSCKDEIRTKIYCYMAACGLLWSNWCEYKSIFGVEFGDYALQQYRFAKDYYRYARERMDI